MNTLQNHKQVTPKKSVKSKNCSGFDLKMGKNCSGFDLKMGKNCSGFDLKTTRRQKSPTRVDSKRCLVCDSLITIPRAHKYCSKVCRTRATNMRHREAQVRWGQERRGAPPERPGDKIQCALCDRWYVQVGTHVVQRHHLTAREYREYLDLDVKRGLIPEWYRKLKGNIALENGTYKNLAAGAKYYFKKGSKTAGRYQRSQQTLNRLRRLSGSRQSQ